MSVRPAAGAVAVSHQKDSPAHCRALWQEWIHFDDAFCFVVSCAVPCWAELWVVEAAVIRMIDGETSSRSCCPSHCRHYFVGLGLR